MGQGKMIAKAFKYFTLLHKRRHAHHHAHIYTRVAGIHAMRTHIHAHAYMHARAHARTARAHTHTHMRAHTRMHMSIHKQDLVTCLPGHNPITGIASRVGNLFTKGSVSNPFKVTPPESHCCTDTCTG